MKNLLICMMYAGECQYEAAKISLAAQEMSDYDVFYLEHVPNQLAYATCYRRFMEEAANYRYFLKFDADFILSDPGVFTRILAHFDDPAVGCVTTDVDDWLSGFHISGMHIYRSDTTWQIRDNEALFVDYGETIKGEIVRIKNRDWVSHNPEPDPYQAFRFGVHRTSKALQPDREAGKRDMSQGISQHTLLQAIARKYVQGDKHPARLWAMLGCEIMYQATDRRIMEYTGAYVRAVFDKLSAQPIESYAASIVDIWEDEMDAANRWLKTFVKDRVI